jgi:hypothetical protein
MMISNHILAFVFILISNIIAFFYILILHIIKHKIKFQCTREHMQRQYMTFPNAFCGNISFPCWLPQANQVLDPKHQSNMKPCDTWEHYGCMLSTLFDAANTPTCERSCTRLKYSVTMSQGFYEPYWSVRHTLSRHTNGA